MARAWRWVVIGSVMTSCGAGRTASAVVVEVDRLEDDRAVVFHAAAGSSSVVPRSQLPPAVKEGDVLVNGRLAPGQTAALRSEVRQAREALQARAERPVSLDDRVAPASPAAATAVSR